MTGDFDTAVRSILGQLIEAREDQIDADKRLHDYRAAKTPPEVPNEFAGAADQLLLFLPEGAPLRYTYQGERSELLSTEYVLVRKQGEIVIQSPSRAPS